MPFSFDFKNKKIGPFDIIIHTEQENLLDGYHDIYKYLEKITEYVEGIGKVNNIIIYYPTKIIPNNEINRLNILEERIKEMSPCSCIMYLY